MPNDRHAEDRRAATHLSRREVLKLGAAAIALGAGGLGVGRFVTGDDPQPQIDLVAGTDDDLSRFSVDIPGAAEASAAIREVSFDALTIDAQGTRPAQARLSVPAETDGAKELADWFTETRTGRGASKDITVTVFRPDRTPALSYSLLDCLPTDWSGSAADGVHTLTVRVGRIDFNV